MTTIRFRNTGIWAEVVMTAPHVYLKYSEILAIHCQLIDKNCQELSGWPVLAFATVSLQSA